MKTNNYTYKDHHLIKVIYESGITWVVYNDIKKILDSGNNINKEIINKGCQKLPQKLAKEAGISSRSLLMNALGYELLISLRCHKWSDPEQTVEFTKWLAEHIYTNLPESVIEKSKERPRRNPGSVNQDYRSKKPDSSVEEQVAEAKPPTMIFPMSDLEETDDIDAMISSMKDQVKEQIVSNVPDIEVKTSALKNFDVFYDWAIRHGKNHKTAMKFANDNISNVSGVDVLEHMPKKRSFVSRLFGLKAA